MQPTLARALEYAARGFAVFPCEGKQPLAGSHGFKDATKDVHEIKLMWGDRDYNIGIATGSVSNLIVIDIDPRNGGDLTWVELVTLGPVPDTPTVMTGGGGTHYWFRYHGAGKMRKTLGKGIDIKSDGGYVIAPESVHPDTGKVYEFELSSDLSVPLAEMPSWLRAKCMETPAETYGIKELPDVVTEGGRHDTLLSIAGTMRRRGLGLVPILAALQAYNAESCRPPCDGAEVDRIARSVLQYEPSESVVAANAAAVEEKPARKTRAPSSELKGPALQLMLEEHIARWLRDRSLVVNALGEWTDPSGRLANTHLAFLAEEFANHFRRSRQGVKVQYIKEIMGETERERAKVAREAIIKPLLAGRGADGSALIDWVIAVTGGADALHIGVMRHWLWMVKRAAAGLPLEHHLMPVFVGPQGSGKSTACHKLCGPLRELAMVPAAVDMLADSKNAPALARYLAGVWDEMEGADKASVEAVKRTITAPKASYRPMTTNSRATVEVRMQWIGTSNKGVASMLSDATGNRRFAEIGTLPRCDWDAIRAIDYTALWACVDHEDEAPILPFMKDLAALQRETVFRDSVAAWLADEEWAGWNDEDGYAHPPRSDFSSIPKREIRTRYFRWCERNHERPLSSVRLGYRIKELGWSDYRPHEGGERAWHYRPPAGYQRSIA